METIHRIMADLAKAYHWQPSEMRQMSIDDLLSFHALI
uniref:Phage P2 GpE family protein n=1 Tax=Hydrogenovibrio crunogenus (strain DSM 25203 / XCL-2) TaxID=317025 RepID=Q0TV68_HYDCU